MPLTNEQLKTQAEFHRRQAKIEIAYQSNRGRDAANQHYALTQTALAEAFEELLDFRVRIVELEAQLKDLTVANSFDLDDSGDFK